MSNGPKSVTDLLGVKSNMTKAYKEFIDVDQMFCKSLFFNFFIFLYFITSSIITIRRLQRLTKLVSLG